MNLFIPCGSCSDACISNITWLAIIGVTGIGVLLVGLAYYIAKWRKD